jgi:hypothetical protein
LDLRPNEVFMSQKSSPLTQRKRFARFAKQLEKGLPPNEEQTNWLIGAFSALSDPNREADRVMGLKYGAGHSLANEQSATKMDVLMHWIAGAISSDTSHLENPNDAEPPMGVEEALHKASELAKILFLGDPDVERYDYAYIKKCWYAKDKQHRQALYRSIDSPDVFYEFPIDE